MQIARLDLSKGLTLNSSDLSQPFFIRKLPFWPKPGGGWESHPGFIPYDIPSLPYTPGTQVYYSDPSGVVALKNGSTLTITDLSQGKVVSGDVGDGVLIPRTGFYRSRFDKLLFDVSDTPAITLSPLKIIVGSLDPGSYRIWALTYVKLKTGFFLSWYSYQSTAITTTNQEGIEIGLANKPEDKVVRLYVQRNKGGSYGPLLYLGQLTGNDDKFTYTSHLQEGEATQIAIPKGTGKFAAYYNGRYFYQADELTLLGGGASDYTPKKGTDPSQDLPSGTYGGHFYLGESLKQAANNVGATPADIPVASTWSAAVHTPKGIFVAVQDATSTMIFQSDSVPSGAWNLVYKGSLVSLQAAAYSPTRVVFLGGGKAIVGPIDGAGSWEEYTLPTANPIKMALWNGSEFAAITDGQLLLGGSSGTAWTVRTPTGSPDFTNYPEWRDFVYAQGRYFILALQSAGGNDWWHRIFVYNGSSWSSFEHRPYDYRGVKFRRYATLWTDGYLLGIGAGLAGGLYYFKDTIFQGPVGEQDYFTFHKASEFPGGFVRFATDINGSLPTTPYGTNIKTADYSGGWFRNGNTFQFVGARPVDGATVERDSITYSGYTLNGATAAAAGTTLTNGVILGTGAYTAAYKKGVGYQLTNVVTKAPLGKSGPMWVEYGAGGENIVEYTKAWSSRKVKAPSSSPASPLFMAYENGTYMMVKRKAGGGFISFDTYELYAGTDLPSMALVKQYTAPNSAIPNMPFLNRLRNVGNKYAFANAVHAYVYDKATNTDTFYNAGNTGHIAFDGTDLFIANSTSVLKLGTGGTATVVYSGTGIVGVMDAPTTGKIIVVTSSGGTYTFLTLDTATSTTTTYGTITTAEPFWGGVFANNAVLVAFQKSLYINSGSGFNQVSSQASTDFGGVYSIGATSPAPPPPPPGSGQSDNASSTISLSPNTIIWTEVGHINQTRSTYYHTVVPRTSTRITGMIEHPAGVMVFLENEAYTMTGAFTSIENTRIALHPQSVGVDPDTIPVRVGSTVFVAWTGRVFAISGGEVSLISYLVADDERFVSVAYDPANTMLVCAKQSGRTVRFDLTNKVWFDDIEGTQALIQLPDQVAYAIYNSTTNVVKLYRLLKPGELAPTDGSYLRLKQEFWIDSLRMSPEPIKRIRAIYIQLKTAGPPAPYLKVYNENETLVASGSMIATLTSNAYGIGRYHFRFPPVISFAPSRIIVSFDNFYMILANDVEVHYEPRQRRI